MGSALLLPVSAQAQQGQLLGLGDKCADVFQASPDAGTPAVLWECTGNANQQWRFNPVADGFEVVGLGDTCLAPGPVGTSGFPELEIGPCGDDTVWTVDPDLTSTFELIHRDTGLCADVLRSDTTNGTPLILFECRGQENQQWRLVGDRSLPAYVVPFYEFNLGFFSETTLFAVRNPGSESVTVRYEYFRDDQGVGDSPITEIRTLGPRAVRTVDVRSVSGIFDREGWIGITAIDPTTGQPLAVQDLYGDYFRLAQTQDFATGDKILETSEALCSQWHSRFLNGGDFSGGTLFRFLVPEFTGSAWTAEGRVYSEAGNLVQVVNVTTSLHSVERSVFLLPFGIDFGAIEWTFTGGVRGHVSVVMDALGRFSVGFGAECRD